MNVPTQEQQPEAQPGMSSMNNDNEMIISFTIPGQNRPTLLKVPLNIMIMPQSLNDDDIVYVNPKQYYRILKRREARAQLVSDGKVIAGFRMPYLHESRHKHAMNRIRNKDGRFQTVTEPAKIKKPKLKKEPNKRILPPRVCKILPALKKPRPATSELQSATSRLQSVISGLQSVIFGLQSATSVPQSVISGPLPTTSELSPVGSGSLPTSPGPLPSSSSSSSSQNVTVPVKAKEELMQPTMNQFVEVKAPIPNPFKIVNQLRRLTKTPGVVLKTHDLYYEVQKGRLKIRTYTGGKADLIFYAKGTPEAERPNKTEYLACPVSWKHSGHALGNILSRSLGVHGEISKTRRLFFLGQSKIHVASIDGLGNFIEIKVSLSATQSESDGQEIAKHIIKDLGLSTDSILTDSYIDMLLQNKV